MEDENENEDQPETLALPNQTSGAGHRAQKTGLVEHASATAARRSQTASQAGVHNVFAYGTQNSGTYDSMGVNALEWLPLYLAPDRTVPSLPLGAMGRADASTTRPLGKPISRLASRSPGGYNV